MIQQPTSPLLRLSIPKLFLRPPLAANSQGWTLIEIGVIAVIVGILASMAIPSMTGVMNKNKVQATANRVKGVFQEAQRAAIRNGSTCTVTITSTTITALPAGCITDPITTNDTSSQNIKIQIPSGTDLINPPTSPATTVAFSYKGNTTNNLTLVITSSQSTVASGSRQYLTKDERCLVVSSGIGIMRSGIYSGTTCTSSF